ncbi:hypothetical protein [Sphingobacterium multivorum]|uniref:hypothetical protein n=1 Tax=Sphingobacterium multivorum TaxID=28454 RepID=UPI002FDE8F1A
MSTRHTQLSSDGFPLYSFREGSSVVLTNASGGKSGESSIANFSTVLPNKNEYSGGRDWVPWGKSDKFPDEMWAMARKSGVAMSALRLLNLKLFGQMVVPAIPRELDDNNQMKYDLVKDQEVRDFFKRSNFDVTRLAIIQDYNALANSFPLLMLNEDRSKIVRIGHDKARKFRYRPYNEKSGRIEKAIRSANFPSPADDFDEFDVIDSRDWFSEVDRIKYVEKGHNYVFPTYYPDPEFDYYSLAHWDGVRSNGWLEISNSIPSYKRAIFRNQAAIKYHVKISMSYWLTKYPKWASMGEAERTKAVNDQYDEMDKYLTGTENAMKTFVSFFDINKLNGTSIPGIEIVAIDDKLKSDAYLPDGAAANAEILFSMLVNPAIFGLGMPGGSYGGANQGGSDIRESWLVMNAINAADRAIIYQMFDFVRDYNGWNPDMTLLTLDKVLTTTDTGKGSKIVS